MALSCLRMPSVLPLPSSVVKFTKKEVKPRVQLKEPKKFPSFSRRETISLLSSTLLTTFLATETAEARPTRSENKRRAFEKLEKLREKAGKTKEKLEPDTNKKENSSPSLSNGFPVPTVEA